jgi:hypothetical protein
METIKCSFTIIYVMLMLLGGACALSKQEECLLTAVNVRKIAVSHSCPLFPPIGKFTHENLGHRIIMAIYKDQMLPLKKIKQQQR